MLLKTVLADSTPVTPKLIGFLYYHGWMCGPSSRRVGQCILELLYRNSFGTFDPGDLDLWPSDTNRVPLLARLDVWTKFEEGTSRRSSVIDCNRKGYRRTDQPTDMHKAIWPALSSLKGGHTHWFWENCNVKLPQKSCLNSAFLKKLLV